MLHRRLAHFVSFAFSLLTLATLAPTALAADATFVRLWPGWRETDSFDRITEFLGGSEPAGGRTDIPASQLPPLAHLGQTALAIRPGEWKHARSQNFVLHYFQTFIAAAVASEAEFYYRSYSAALGKDTTTWERPCHIFVFETDADWAAFRTSGSLDPWTGGLHSGNQLFIERDPKLRWKGKSLGHEVAHLVLDRFYGGSNIPLWLNEGYAEYASSKAYAAYFRARGYRAAPVSEPLDPARYVPIEQFVNTVSYPADTALVGPFYTQSEKLVRFLSADSDAQFQLFLAETARGRAFPSALFSAYGSRFPAPSDLEREFQPYAIKDFAR